MTRFEKKHARKHTKSAKFYTHCDNCQEILVNMGEYNPHLNHTFYHLCVNKTSGKVDGWRSHCVFEESDEFGPLG